MKAVWRAEDGLLRMRWELDDEAFGVFERYGVVETPVKGHTIFRKGDASESLFLVLEGEVAITRDGTLVGVVPANYSFGEMGLLLGYPRIADATARTDARLLKLSKKDLEQMDKTEPVWASRLFRMLAECLAEYLHRVSQSQSPSRLPDRPGP